MSTEICNTCMTIAGMSCGGCAKRVEAAIRAVDGVVDCCVNLSNGSATVTFDPRLTDPLAIADSVTRAGYRATAKWEQLI